MKFPKYIKYLVDSEQYRLVALAKKSGVHASDLSKILNQKRVCGLKMAMQIIGGLQEEHQGQALVSWLVDQIPPQFHHMVHIVRSETGKLQDSSPDIGTLEGTLLILGIQAESNDALRVCLFNMARAFMNKS